MKANSSITIPKELVDKLVTEYLAKEKGITPTSIVPNMTERCEGYGMSETYVKVFNGMVVYFEMDI